MRRQPRPRRRRRAEAREASRQLVALHGRQGRALRRRAWRITLGLALAVGLGVAEVGLFPGGWAWSLGLGLAIALAGLGLVTFWDPAPPSLRLRRWLGRPAYWGATVAQAALLGAACVGSWWLVRGAVPAPEALALWLPVVTGVAAVTTGPLTAAAWEARSGG